MADRELRRLERIEAVEATHSTSLRLLLTRIRTGQIDPNMVELAAYCGHSLSREVMGRNDVEQDCCREFGAGCKLLKAGLSNAAASFCAGDYFKLWLEGLTHFGRNIMLIAAVAVAKGIEAESEESRAVITSGVASISRWIDCPCDKHEREWLDCYTESIVIFGCGQVLPGPYDNARLIGNRILSAARVIGNGKVRQAIERALIAHAFSRPV